MSKKYEIIFGNKKKVGCKLCYQIRALKTFQTYGGKITVYKGEYGGYVDDYHNLSQTGSCWIHGNAAVIDKAHVCDDAQIAGSAVVSGRAVISGEAEIKCRAVVKDSAQVKDQALVTDQATIKDKAIIEGKAMIYGQATISEEAHVREEARVFGKASLSGSARANGLSIIRDFAKVRDNAKIQNYANLKGNAKIGGNTEINEPKDYIVMGPIGSRNDYLTICKNGDICTGCFSGSNKEFRQQAIKTHGINSLYYQEYKKAVGFARRYFKMREEYDG